MQRTDAEMCTRGTAQVNFTFRKSVAYGKWCLFLPRQVQHSFLSLIYRLICQSKGTQDDRNFIVFVGLFCWYAVHGNCK